MLCFNISLTGNEAYACLRKSGPWSQHYINYQLLSLEIPGLRYVVQCAVFSLDLKLRALSVISMASVNIGCVERERR